MRNFNQIYICSAAMGYSVYLYILHDIQKAYFCDCDPCTRYEDNEEEIQEIDEVFGIETLKTYGTEIPYNKAIEIKKILNNEL